MTTRKQNKNNNKQQAQQRKQQSKQQTTQKQKEQKNVYNGHNAQFPLWIKLWPNREDQNLSVQLERES